MSSTTITRVGFANFDFTANDPCTSRLSLMVFPALRDVSCNLKSSGATSQGIPRAEVILAACTAISKELSRPRLITDARCGGTGTSNNGRVVELDKAADQIARPNTNPSSLDKARMP
jgi:hypothetical protein